MAEDEERTDDAERKDSVAYLLRGPVKDPDRWMVVFDDGDGDPILQRTDIAASEEAPHERATAIVEEVSGRPVGEWHRRGKVSPALMAPETWEATVDETRYAPGLVKPRQNVDDLLDWHEG